jgi:hypothetical protein
MEQGENQSADNLVVSSSDNNELEGNCTGLVAARFSKSHIIVNTYITQKRDEGKTLQQRKMHATKYLFTVYRDLFMVLKTM